jgi:hypothetical protein
MRQNCILSKNAKSLLLLTGIRMARLLPLAAVAFGLAASLSPKPVHAQECACREKATSIASIKHRAMSVDSIGHRRLCFECAFAFPEQAARFQPKSIESHENR